LALIHPPLIAFSGPSPLKNLNLGLPNGLDSFIKHSGVFPTSHLPSQAHLSDHTHLSPKMTAIHLWLEHCNEFIVVGCSRVSHNLSEIQHLYTQPS
jgi:hypothetical protein